MQTGCKPDGREGAGQPKIRAPATKWFIITWVGQREETVPPAVLHLDAAALRAAADYLGFDPPWNARVKPAEMARLVSYFEEEGLIDLSEALAATRAGEGFKFAFGNEGGDVVAKVLGHDAARPIVQTLRDRLLTSPAAVNVVTRFAAVYGW